LINPIVKATGCTPYVIGKPNHLMIRGVDPGEATMSGDSRENDINVGIQAQMKTILVLSSLCAHPALKALNRLFSF